MHTLLTSLVLAAALAGAVPAPAPEVAEVEAFRIRVVNDAGGAVTVSTDGGATWQPAGTVVAWCGRVNPNGFTASVWAVPGTVAATAVNALHILTHVDAATGRGVIFSILPKDQIGVDPAKFPSYLSPEASLYLDTPAGGGIFGGGWAPLVGNEVFLESPDGPQRLAPEYVPQRGDTLLIRVTRPQQYPKALVFENRFGGVIWLEWLDGTCTPIGTVYRPVYGVGRFIGTQWAGFGRIRANHPGVIDISLAPLGAIAGIQIIPAAHALSPEMRNARLRTQWMIVGPLSPLDPSWEGVAPLFARYIRPQYRPNDIYADDWEARLLDRFLVEVQLDGGDWQPPPHFALDPDMTKALPATFDAALEHVTAIRILFPIGPLTP